MLQKGLSINSNIFSLSMKELSLLYEYWCFIKINSLQCSNINLAEHNIKFVALAQSKKQFAGDAGINYYGRIVDIKVMKRNKITEIPSKSEEDYYIFKIG